jgi:pyruvate dehydrogenase E1 component alpha subunit
MLKTKEIQGSDLSWSGVSMATDPLGLFCQMLFIRQVEEAIAARYTEQEMRCPVHLSVGQESAAVGVCAALQRADRVFSTHRCHAHYLAKGGDLKRMLAEIYGKAAGCCRGRGGSMHLFDVEAGIIASVPIVASSIPLAVGSALSSKIDADGAVSVAFLGDGSLEEGVFHESANFASLNMLPMIFACENNLYSVYTPLCERQPDRPISRLAAAHGMAYFDVDGDDVLAVFDAASNAVAHARSARGPVFLNINTYRWREHCGPNYDNHIGYRTEAEFEKWRNRDAVVRLRAQLVREGVLTAASEARMISNFQTKIEDAIAFAKSSPLPNPSDASKYVYAEMVS